MWEKKLQDLLSTNLELAWHNFCYLMLVKASQKPRFKGWENKFYLMMGRIATLQRVCKELYCKGYGFKDRSNFHGHLCKPSTTSRFTSSAKLAKLPAKWKGFGQRTQDRNGLVSNRNKLGNKYASGPWSEREKVSEREGTSHRDQGWRGTSEGVPVSLQIRSLKQKGWEGLQRLHNKEC